MRDGGEQLIVHPEALRTIVSTTEPVQLTAPATTVEWRMVDMTGLSSYAGSLTKVQSEETDALFDIVKGLLLGLWGKRTKN